VPPIFDDYGQYETFVATALGSNPNIKVLLSIGGGTSNASLFANMVSTAANRKVFIDTSIALATQYNYSGLDLDWEFPASQTEMTNLGTFFQEWNAATVAESQSSGKAKLLLTAAVYYQTTFIYEQNQSYNITAINSYLDWVNVMTYGYHGSWESQTGEHTTLYDPSRPNLNTDYGVSNWLSSGLDASKLVMGLAFYGESWVLSSLNNTGIGAPTSSFYEDISYSDIVTFNTNSSVVVVQDNTTVCMYSYNTASLVWIGYDSPTTITSKVQYAKNKSIGGYFAWNLAQDDSNWSLAKAASNAWV
jgi:chitinase